MEPLGGKPELNSLNPLQAFGFGPEFLKGVTAQARQPIGTLLGKSALEYLPEYKNAPSPGFENLPELKSSPSPGFSPLSSFSSPSSFFDNPFARQLQGTPLAGFFPSLSFLQPPRNDPGYSILRPRENAGDPFTPSREARSGWLPKYTDAPLVEKVQERKANIAAGNEPVPQRAQTSGDLVAGYEEFGNAQLEAAFAQAGLAGLTDAACGPIAIAGMLRAFGMDKNPALIARDAFNAGEWRADGMQRGNGDGVAAVMSAEGLPAENNPIQSQQDIQDMISLVSSGTPVVLNFPTHYMLAQAYDPATGKFFVGATGSNALRGGADWMSVQEMNAAAGNGGRLESYIAPTAAAPASPTSTGGYPSASGGADPNASPQEVEAYIRQSARVRGIDPNVAVRVALGEGGFDVARRGTFNTGSSWWPFQLHYGGPGYENLGTTAGMGTAFTQQTGFQPGDPRAWAASVDYALNAAAAARSWGPWYGRKWYNVGISEGFGPQTRPV